MKLYATTNSERASKGQGGNDYIEVQITDENKKGIYSLIIMPHKEGHLILENLSAYVQKRQGGGYKVDSNEAFIRFVKLKSERQKEKGKRQKGEAVCMNCNSVQKAKDINYLGDSKWNCPNCI